MTTIFVFGLLMGVRHAFDADHLAAVASLATRSVSVRAGVLQGAAWGLGHTLALLVIGAICLFMGTAMPQRWAMGLEIAVGVMLLVLGADVVRRMRRERLHIHVHEHGSGTRHWHAHRHRHEPVHDRARHEHAHPAGLPVRALAVGLVHGLAGSAALFLLTLQATPSFWVGIVYVGVFGLGSILGMAALSAVIAVPLHTSARILAGLHDGLEVLVGLTTLVIGLRVLYQVVR
jgi:sulfite exporter TauE/SafE